MSIEMTEEIKRWTEYPPNFIDTSDPYNKAS